MSKQTTNKDEIINLLNRLTNDDPEVAHSVADNLLLDALLLAGMDDVVKAYELAAQRVGFWYA